MSDQLNPIQREIAKGVNPIVAFLSQATCGENCWEAREDVCHCSCNGKNHGCMRDANGTRPGRTAKIDGFRYMLKAADVENIYSQAEAINRGQGKRKFSYGEYWWNHTDKGAPARVKPATKDQIARWPELASFREQIEAIKQSESWCWKQVFDVMPYLLWVREDIATQSEK